MPRGRPTRLTKRKRGDDESEDEFVSDVDFENTTPSKRTKSAPKSTPKPTPKKVATPVKAATLKAASKKTPKKAADPEEKEGSVIEVEDSEASESTAGLRRSARRANRRSMDVEAAMEIERQDSFNPNDYAYESNEDEEESEVPVKTPKKKTPKKLAAPARAAAAAVATANADDDAGAVEAVNTGDEADDADNAEVGDEEEPEDETGGVVTNKRKFKPLPAAEMDTLLTVPSKWVVLGRFSINKVDPAGWDYWWNPWHRNQAHEEATSTKDIVFFDLSDNSTYRSNCRLLDAELELVSQGIFQNTLGDGQISAYQLIPNFPFALLNNSEDNLEKLLFAYSLEEADEEKHHQFELELTFNIGRFEWLVRKGYSIPNANILFTMVSSEVQVKLNTAAPRDFRQASIPIQSVTSRAQPEGIKLRLFKYQLDAVNWMQGIENASDRAGEGYAYCTLVPWHLGKTDVMFDLQYQTFASTPDEVAIYSNKVKSRGGVLADEMGLGKTLEVVALALTHPAPIPLKRHGALFSTKATLVIAPNHLCKQWQQEIEKHTEPQLKCVLVTTKVQHKKVTYQDFIDADFVIVSHSLLRNPNYFRIGQSGVSMTGPKRGEWRDRINVCRRHLHQVKKRKDGGLTAPFPVLDLFYWHRIVLDEAHEVMNDEFYVGTFTNINSSYRWYVTGTPFPNPQTINGARQFIKFQGKGWNETPTLHNYGNSADQYQKWVVNDIMFNNYFWRHTKESAGSEFHVPKVVEDVILLDFTDIERTLYRDAGGDELRQRQICCAPQLSRHDLDVLGTQKKSLDEIRVAMIDHKEKIKREQLDEQESLHFKIDEALPAKLAKIAKKLKAHKDKVKVLSKSDKEKVEARKKRYEKEFDNAQLRLEKLKAEITANNSMLLYFKSIVPKIEQSSKEPCTICFDEITELTITDCGHLYCNKCIKDAVAAQGKCPLCRADLKLTSLTEVAREEEKKKVESNQELKRLIQEHGTKMAHIITYLQGIWARDPESRVIIFSQFDRLLIDVGNILRTNDIENVYIKGQVHQRNKAISEFKKPESKIKVVMLSLEHAASGTNLTEASYVFLLDPVSGTREEARAVEGQAIGRAVRQGQTKQVTVVRHIIRDTIEHVMYLNTAAMDIADAETENNAPAPAVAAAADAQDEDMMDEEVVATTTTTTTSTARVQSAATLLRANSALNPIQLYDSDEEEEKDGDTMEVESPAKRTQLLTRQDTEEIKVNPKEERKNTAKSVLRQGSAIAIGRSGSVLVGANASSTPTATAKAGSNKSPISISTAGGALHVVRSGSLSSLLANAPDLIAKGGVSTLLEEFPDLTQRRQRSKALAWTSSGADTAMIYNFYIFNRKGTCIFYQEFVRPVQAENLEEEQKLLFGFLKAIVTFVERVSPEAGDVFNCYSTSSYRLHYFETATGLRLAINTDIKTPNMQKDLKKIYGDYIVEYVSKNPLSTLEEPITCQLFVTNVNKFLRGHPNFKSE